MVAAFGNFQVGVVARRQLHALFRHRAQERVVLWFGDVVMNMFQHLLVAVWTGDLQHLRVHFTDLVFFAPGQPVTITLPFSVRASPMASSDSDRAVDEPAGVDDHHVGVVVAWHHVIAFSAKFSQDAFGVHRVLRAAQGRQSRFSAGA